MAKVAINGFNDVMSTNQTPAEDRGFDDIPNDIQNSAQPDSTAPFNDKLPATMEEAGSNEIATNPEPPASQPAPATDTSNRTVAGGTWVALIIGAFLLILLLVFILQNQDSVELTLFAWSFQFPAGIGFLLAAITGALIMALVGGVRMFEYRRKIKKLKKSL